MPEVIDVPVQPDPVLAMIPQKGMFSSAEEVARLILEAPRMSVHGKPLSIYLTDQAYAVLVGTLEKLGLRVEKVSEKDVQEPHILISITKNNKVKISYTGPDGVRRTIAITPLQSLIEHLLGRAGRKIRKEERKTLYKITGLSEETIMDLGSREEEE